MTGEELNPLKSRWNSPKYVEVGMRALLGGGSSPFPRLGDGRQDLRGLRITQIIRGVTIRDADLSDASVDGFGQFVLCTVERCLFRNSILTSNNGGSFSDCEFVSARMSGAVVRGAFTNCDFTSANLSNVIGSQVNFVKCVFDKAKFRRATLIHCLFEDCTFEDSNFGGGSVAFSRFRKCRIEATALKNTLVENVITE